MDAPLDHAEVASSLQRLRMGVGASELHGSLAGFLCAGGVARPESWLADLAMDELAEAVAGSSDRNLFARVFAAVHESLDDPGLGFGPLLPDDEASIDERAGALVDWCRGFLGGVGLAGGELEPALGGDVGEVLHDFGRIAATRFGEGDDVDEDEEAYAEVVEYVRVGALLVRTELARSPEASTRH